MQKSPTSREIQSTMRDHLTPIRMATIKKKIKNKTGNTSVGKDMEKLTGNAVFASRIVKRYQPLWKTVWSSSKNKNRNITQFSTPTSGYIYTKKN